MARLIDYDPVTKTKTLFHDLGGDQYTIESVSDVEDVIEANKAIAATVDERARFGDVAHVASIPMAVVDQLIQDGVLGPGGTLLDERRFKRWLNDKDNRAFRTRPGRV